MRGAGGGREAEAGGGGRRRRREAGLHWHLLLGRAGICRVWRKPAAQEAASLEPGAARGVCRHTRSRTHTCTHTHSCTHTLAQTCTHPHIHSCDKHMYPRTYAHTCAHAHTHTHAHVHTYATHACTHAHHAHTHTPTFKCTHTPHCTHTHVHTCEHIRACAVRGDFALRLSRHGQPCSALSRAVSLTRGTPGCRCFSVPCPAPVLHVTGTPGPCWNLPPLPERCPRPPQGKPHCDCAKCIN